MKKTAAEESFLPDARKSDAFVKEVAKQFNHKHNITQAYGSQKRLAAAVRIRYDGESARPTCVDALRIVHEELNANLRSVDFTYHALLGSFERLSGQRVSVERRVVVAAAAADAATTLDDLRALVDTISDAQTASSSFAGHLAYVERLAAEDPSLSVRALAADEAACIRIGGRERRKYDSWLESARLIIVQTDDAMHAVFKFGYAKALWAGIEWALPEGAHEMHDEIDSLGGGIP
jgi:hypothetical protein